MVNDSYNITRSSYLDELEKFTENADMYLSKIKDSVKRLTAGNINEELLEISRLLESAHKNGQTDLVSKLLFFITIKKKEYKIIESGFSEYIDMEPMLRALEKFKEVKMIYLRNYTRYIPEDVSEKLRKAKSLNLFNDYVVLYTDYTGKTGENLKKAGVKKSTDPILFGLYTGKIDVNNKDAKIEKLSTIYDRVFIIGDWIDNECDLTLEKLIENSDKNKRGKYAIEVHDLGMEIDAPMSKNEILSRVDKLIQDLEINIDDLK